MKHAILFLFLLACSSSSPHVASTSASGAGGAAGDDMSGLFTGGRGGSDGLVLLDGGGGAAGTGGSSGTGAGAGGEAAEDGGPDAQMVDGGVLDGALVDAGPGLDPECEGLELPNSDCRCAGFETRAYFFCPGPLDKAGAVASCFSIAGLVLIGNIDLPNQNPAKYNFIRDWSGEVVWMLGTLGSTTPPYTMLCNVLTADGTMPVDCSELHAYVCEEKL